VSNNFFLNTANNISKTTEITSPLDQFEIRNLISLDIPVLNNLHLSLTNIGLYLSIAVFVVLTLSLLATNYNKVVSNN
jgi:F-type H+-transporting ATPase subunit a